MSPDQLAAHSMCPIPPPGVPLLYSSDSEWANFSKLRLSCQCTVVEKGSVRTPYF